MSADIEAWPPPGDANAFESLCLDLWKEIWNDPGAQKNGRSGQPQAGIDVFGLRDGQQMGVQCKQKNGLVRTKVTIAELDREVKEAQNFRPALNTFVLATTGPRDVHVQERARLLSAENKSKGLFNVEVWSWNDIWHELYQREELIKRVGPIYWPRRSVELRAGPRQKVVWTLGGLICAVLGFVFVVPSLRDRSTSTIRPAPIVSLDVGPSLNPSQPFETRLILKNDGNETIYDVFCIGLWNDPKGPMRHTLFSSGAMIQNLEPKKQHSLKIDHPPLQFSERVNVTIEIKFRTKSPTTNVTSSFEFLVLRNGNGEYIWLPRGEGRSLYESISRITKQQQRIMDTIPLLDVHVISAEDYSSVDKTHPLKLTYSWQNIGGQPATDIYLEWIVTDFGKSFFMSWTNLWPEALNKQLLYPGNSNSTSTFYHATVLPLIEGINVGKFNLLGMVHYKDIEGNDYEMKLFAVHTNSAFIVNCFETGGHFDAIKRRNKIP